MPSFRVRLKGFNFTAHVPPDFVRVTDDVLAQDAVPAEWLHDVDGHEPTPCTWLVVDAETPMKAQAAFLAAHKITKAPRAPFVVEVLEEPELHEDELEPVT